MPGCTKTKVWAVIIPVELVFYFFSFQLDADSIISLHLLHSLWQWWWISPDLHCLLHALIAVSDHLDHHEPKRHWCTCQTMHPWSVYVNLFQSCHKQTCASWSLATTDQDCLLTRLLAGSQSKSLSIKSSDPNTNYQWCCQQWQWKWIVGMTKKAKEKQQWIRNNYN